MNRTHQALIAGIALAGLLSGTATRAVAATAPDSSAKAGQQLADNGTDAHSCKGQNTCKGKGGCKSGDNGCKGQNTCKGKGGCKSS